MLPNALGRHLDVVIRGLLDLFGYGLLDFFRLGQGKDALRSVVLHDAARQARLLALTAIGEEICDFLLQAYVVSPATFTAATSSRTTGTRHGVGDTVLTL